MMHHCHQPHQQQLALVAHPTNFGSNSDLYYSTTTSTLALANNNNNNNFASNSSLNSSTSSSTSSNGASPIMSTHANTTHPTLVEDDSNVTDIITEAATDVRVVHLQLSSCVLNCIPQLLDAEWVGRISHVYLARNSLTLLPRWFCHRFQCITRLYLHTNALTALPSDIGCLSNLTDLMLSNNRIDFLPDQLGKLTRLRQLSVSHNLISSLPPTLVQLRSLELLNIGLNPLPVSIVRGEMQGVNEIRDFLYRACTGMYAGELLLMLMMMLVPDAVGCMHMQVNVSVDVNVNVSVDVNAAVLKQQTLELLHVDDSNVRARKRDVDYRRIKRAVQKGWTPHRHSIFPEAVRETVRVLMALNLPHCESPFALLPPELMFMIIDTYIQHCVEIRKEPIGG
jgi:hypothetical protein